MLKLKTYGECSAGAGCGLPASVLVTGRYVAAVRANGQLEIEDGEHYVCGAHAVHYQLEGKVIKQEEYC